MATPLAIAYSVGDTVYRWYAHPHTLYFTPTVGVVSNINVTASGDVALVSFTSGENIIDSAATPRIFTTQALCAKAIIDDVIVRAAPTVLLDTTLSGASTAGLTATTLIRKG